MILSTMILFNPSILKQFEYTRMSLKSELCLVAPEEAGERDIDEGSAATHVENCLHSPGFGQKVAVPVFRQPSKTSAEIVYIHCCIGFVLQGSRKGCSVESRSCIYTFQ